VSHWDRGRPRPHQRRTRRKRPLDRTHLVSH